MNYDQLLTIDEMAAVLKVTKSFLYSHTSKKTIPFIKLGKRHLRFQKEKVIAALIELSNS